MDMDHKAFSIVRMLTDSTLYSASSTTTFPFVQSMTVLYNNTQYNPCLSLRIRVAHSDLSGLMPVSKPKNRKICNDL